MGVIVCERCGEWWWSRESRLVVVVVVLQPMMMESWSQATMAQASPSHLTLSLKFQFYCCSES